MHKIRYRVAVFSPRYVKICFPFIISPAGRDGWWRGGSRRSRADRWHGAVFSSYVPYTDRAQWSRCARTQSGGAPRGAGGAGTRREIFFKGVTHVPLLPSPALLMPCAFVLFRMFLMPYPSGYIALQIIMSVGCICFAILLQMQTDAIFFRLFFPFYILYYILYCIIIYLYYILYIHYYMGVLYHLFM